jgi:hypothetical protein
MYISGKYVTDYQYKEIKVIPTPNAVAAVFQCAFST